VGGACSENQGRWPASFYENLTQEQVLPPSSPEPRPRAETPAVSSLEAEGALSAPCSYAWVPWFGTARTRPPWRMTPLPGALRADRSPGAALQRAPRPSDGVGRTGRRRAPDRGARPRRAAMPPCRSRLGPARRTARPCLGSRASVKLQRSRAGRCPAARLNGMLGGSCRWLGARSRRRNSTAPPLGPSTSDGDSGASARDGTSGDVTG
jgi:hypothetical protein